MGTHDIVVSGRKMAGLTMPRVQSPRASRLAPRASRLAPRASRLAPLHVWRRSRLTRAPACRAFPDRRLSLSSVPDRRLSLSSVPDRRKRRFHDIAAPIAPAATGRVFSPSAARSPSQPLALSASRPPPRGEGLHNCGPAFHCAAIRSPRNDGPLASGIACARARVHPSAPPFHSFLLLPGRCGPRRAPSLNPHALQE